MPAAEPLLPGTDRPAAISAAPQRRAQPAAGGAAARWRHIARGLGLALCLAAPAGLLQAAGWPGLVGALPLAWLLAWRLARATDQATSSQSDAERAMSPDAGPVASRPEAARLTSQVVPVWSRNIDAARSYAEQSMAQLLESFSGVTNHLDKALEDANGSLQLDVGSTDTLIALHQDKVDHLVAQTREAVSLKDAMHQELSGVTSVLGEMARLTREVQDIGRATHLLALNASVEANRSGQASGGGSFMVVAQEIRRLAGQSRDCSSSMTRHLAGLQARLEDLDHRYRRDEAEIEEVELRAEQAARLVVVGVLDSLAAVTRASRELRLAGHQVKGDIDNIFVSLQSQDRTSQMLGSVIDDMKRYTQWLHGEDDPAAANPADWLDRLDKSYTMEDMRSSHLGVAGVQQNSSIEFF